MTLISKRKVPVVPQGTSRKVTITEELAQIDAVSDVVVSVVYRNNRFVIEIERGD